MLEVWSGFVRPWTLLRALRTQPEAWRRFVRVTWMQLGLTTVVGLVAMAIGDTPALVAQNERRAKVSQRRELREAAQALASARDGGRVDPPETLGGEELEDEAREEVRQAGAFARVSAWFAFIVSALVIGQWVTLALTREFQGATGRALSQLANIEPEDPDVPPRFRLDLKWLRKKFQQRVRGLLVLVPGFFALIPLWVVTSLFDVSELVMPLPTFAWGAYWWVSFTSARSARAWKEEKAAIPPWPVRWWVEQTKETPGFMWFFPRWVGKIGLMMTRRDAAPAVAMERAPFELIGLSLARLVTSPPLIRLIFRTAIDTAIAETLELHAPKAQPDLIQGAAESTQDAAT